MGAQVTVEVRAFGIPMVSDGSGLFGFGFAIRYDGAGLQSSDPVLGALWLDTGFDGTLLDAAPPCFTVGSIQVIPEPEPALLMGLGLTS